MIEVTSNIEVVLKAKLAQIQELRNNPDAVLRTVALAVLPELRHRVHVEGKDSAGQQIGTYSPGYMVVRTGNYKDAAKFKRGENAGQYKTKKKAGEAGKFTKGEEGKVGTNRPVYNRTADTKVILSLTRQMENDETVVKTDEGYGIGFLNPFNFKKAGYCEKTYKKPILTKLTKEELELVQRTAEKWTVDYLKK